MLRPYHLEGSGARVGVVQPGNMNWGILQKGAIDLCPRPEAVSPGQPALCSAHSHLRAGDRQRISRHLFLFHCGSRTAQVDFNCTLPGDAQGIQHSAGALGKAARLLSFPLPPTFDPVAALLGSATAALSRDVPRLRERTPQTWGKFRSRPSVRAALCHSGTSPAVPVLQPCRTTASVSDTAFSRA